MFTDEDTSNIIDLGPSPHPQMPDIKITNEGVEKLLENLNTSKLSRPDNIHPKVLREPHSELVPLITAIFQQTLQQGTVPYSERQTMSPLHSRRVSIIVLLTTDLAALMLVFYKLQEHIATNSKSTLLLHRC